MNFYDITIHVFLEMIVEWIFEYYVFALALFWKAERRDHFFLRFFGGLVLVCGFSYLLAIFYYNYGETVLGRSFVYAALFGLALAHLYVCFKKDFLKVVLIGDFAYLTQNITYKIFIFVYCSVTYFSGGTFHLADWQYKIVYYSQFFAQAAIACTFLCYNARKRLLDAPVSRLVIVASVFTALVSIVLSSLHDVYIQSIAQDLYNSPSSAVYFLRVSGYMMAVLLDVSILIMIFSTSRQRSLQKDVSDLQYLVQQSAKQYEISQQTIDAINIKCHDMKHRINKIVGDTLPEDAKRSISDSIAIYDALIDTGNKTLDVVLTEKSLTCESNHIAFTKTADGSAVDFMSVGDIFCLFGNLLDNAIEAAKNVEDAGKRYIDFRLVKMGEGIACIDCANYFSGQRQFENGLPQTTKEDTFNHGFGVKSIKEIVKRYNGSVTFQTKDNIFSVSIVFYNV